MIERSCPAAHRYRWTVPALCIDTQRGRRFAATWQARPGLTIGSTSFPAQWLRVPGHSGTRLPQFDHDLGKIGKVTCGIEVTIEHQTALVTAEEPDAQRQLGFHYATVRTSLRAGKPPVGDHDTTAAPSGLVGKHTAQCTPTGISYGRCQALVAHHAFDIEVLYYQCRPAAGKRRGELVQSVSTQVRHPVVHTVAFPVCLVPPVRRLLPTTAIGATAAGQLPTSTPQPMLRGVESSWIGDETLVVRGAAQRPGEHSQMRHPEVNADRRVRSYGSEAGGLVRFQCAQPGKRHMFAVSINADGTGGKPAGQRRPTLALAFRRTHSCTRAATVAAGLVVVERSGGVCQPGVVRLFRVLAPPRREIVLNLVPPLAERGQIPRPPLGQFGIGNTVGLFRDALVPRGQHPRHRPVIGEPCRTTMRHQVPALSRRRIEGHYYTLIALSNPCQSRTPSSTVR